MSARINWGFVYENVPQVLLDRISDSDASYPTADDISTITIKSYDLDTEEEVYSGTAEPADVVQASLSTGNGWTKDATGWNCQFLVDGDAWPEGGKTYRVEIILTTTGGHLLPSVWELTCITLHSRAGS